MVKGPQKQRGATAGQFLHLMKNLRHHGHAPGARGIRRLQARQVGLVLDQRHDVVQGRRHVFEEHQRQSQGLGFDVVDVPNETRRVEAIVDSRLADAANEGLRVGVEELTRLAHMDHGELMHLYDERHLIGAAVHGRFEPSIANLEIKLRHGSFPLRDRLRKSGHTLDIQKISVIIILLSPIFWDEDLGR